MTNWKRLTLATDQSHHLQEDGRPAYQARFTKVLKFHEPGLAPARDASGAFHIDPAGAQAYARRHISTFGFYFGLAAVTGPEGWYHIRPEGEAAYAERYDFCGNFQNGLCVVRDREDRYLHIQVDGAPAYVERHTYAGDFRDGAAVVQSRDGLHTHIDRAGRFAHGRWFVDLDVFHKGFARARDEHGWHHIDFAARPAYPRRFAAVEPFYNGQARVVGLDGSLEVVDEQGRTLVILGAPKSASALRSRG